jgi:hypothetical protein
VLYVPTRATRWMRRRRPPPPPARNSLSAVAVAFAAYCTSVSTQALGLTASVCLSFWLAGVCVRTDVFFAGTGRRLAMLCFKSCQV